MQRRVNAPFHLSLWGHTMLSKQLADFLKYWEQAPNVAADKKNKTAFNTETLPSVSWEVN